MEVLQGLYIEEWGGGGQRGGKENYYHLYYGLQNLVDFFHPPPVVLRLKATLMYFLFTPGGIFFQGGVRGEERHSRTPV